MEDELVQDCGPRTRAGVECYPGSIGAKSVVKTARPFNGSDWCKGIESTEAGIFGHEPGRLRMNVGTP